MFYINEHHFFATLVVLLLSGGIASGANKLIDLFR